MNTERFIHANIMALITHGLVSVSLSPLRGRFVQTQPMDLVKTRSQILQEGRPFNGVGFFRGFYPYHIFDEVYRAGGGFRKMYSGLDAWFLRTVTYTTARIWSFLWFLDRIHHDPRRTPRPDYMFMAGMPAGMVAGALSNPVELVFTRMQVDEMYPEGYRRNYKGVVDGLLKACDEGVLMRGAAANGLKIGFILSSMTGVFDYTKEIMYYYIGPHFLNRFVGTLVACTVGMTFSMPFDAVKTRMHTMRPLPDGRMPYSNSLDCFVKICKYESSNKWVSNPGGSFFAGGQAYLARLFAICWVTQYLLDYYHGANMVSEFWQPAAYHFQTGIDYDVHDPYTDAFNKPMVQSWAHEAEQ